MAGPTVSGNFAKDFIIALAVTAAVTVAFLALICVFAQCGPRMCGRIDRKERWFQPSLEEEQLQELPLERASSNDMGRAGYSDTGRICFGEIRLSNQSYGRKRLGDTHDTQFRYTGLP
ncbi:hypothetical protein F4779DRAFT_616499 [Xylariaceae sp. FL0662B]|nr:hypothetical protein F4779DRAFT_616499 [Xylariaceae sp. FL0662B]